VYMGFGMCVLLLVVGVQDESLEGEFMDMTVLGLVGEGRGMIF